MRALSLSFCWYIKHWKLTKPLSLSLFHFRSLSDRQVPIKQADKPLSVWSRQLYENINLWLAIIFNVEMIDQNNLD